MSLMDKIGDFIPPGRKLPHSIEAEMAVLGAILLESGKAWPEVAGKVAADDFALSEHRRIFAAIQSVADSGGVADPVTIKPLLNGDLQACGGDAYFLRLADAGVTPINAGQYARLIRDMAIRRRIIEVCGDIEGRAYSEDGGSVNELLADMDVFLRDTHISMPELPQASDVCGPKIPPNLPDEFWAASDLLSSIRDYAHYRYASADAVLGEVLARASAYCPPTTRLRTIISDETPLNFFCISIGASEAGKSVAASVGRDIIGVTDCDRILGSGAGIVESFMGEREEPPEVGSKKPTLVRCQTAYNAFLSADEGADFVAKLSRTDETMAAVICSAFTSEPIGSQLASKERNRLAKGYSIGIRVNFQPTVLAPLAKLVGIGLPSRFIYLSATDPSGVGGAFAPRPSVGCHHIGTLTCAPEIDAECRARREAARKGELVSEPFDKHYILIMLKTAACLAYIHGERVVTTEHWRLARMVWETSRGVRDFALEATAAADEAELAERASVASVMRNAAVYSDDRIARMADRIRRFLAKHPGASDRDIRKSVVNKSRGEGPLFVAALAIVRG